MKAVIMAGGEGTRLRPLTCTIPKPLVPVAGKPAMTHILELLKRHSISEAAVTTMYLADMISDMYKNEYDGVKLTYFVEDTGNPLGTAGSVKNAADFLDSDFIVISGDGICDIDLTEATKFHYEKNADVTIVLSQIDNPLEYGVVLCGANGEITRFIEKPAWSQAFSDLVNTGIYIIKRDILDMIPEKCAYDFSRDLFKRMLKDKKALYGYRSDSYWCDIGDLNAFYRCNLECSNENPILGKSCNIAKSAYIKNSVVFDNVEIGDNCIVDGAIICENAKIGKNVIVRPGCVVGANSVLHDRVSLRRDIKIWFNKEVDEGMTVMDDIIFGKAVRDIDLFDERGLSGDTGILSAEYCVKLGEAVAAAAKYGKIGVIGGSSEYCKLVRESLLCGLYAGGAQSYDFGEGFEAIAAYTAAHFRLNLLICVSDKENYNDTIRLTMYDADGLYPERGLERALVSALSRPDMKRNGNGKDKFKLNPIERFNSIKFLYYSELVHSVSTNLKELSVSLNDTEPALILAKALRELGAEITDETNSRLHININEAGDDINLKENTSSYKYDADMWHIAAIIEQSELNGGLKQLVLPYAAPMCLEKIASDAGVTVVKYASCPADSSENNIRAMARSQIWLKDACFAALKICSLIKSENITVHELAGRIPQFYNTVSEYDAENKYKTLVLKELGKPENEGGIITFGEAGNVKIIPRRQNGFKLIAEAVNMEVADEIMWLAKKRIKEIINGEYNKD